MNDPEPDRTTLPLISRRRPSRHVLAGWCLAGLCSAVGAASPAAVLKLDLEQPALVARPLQKIAVAASVPGTLSILDGAGREYFRSSVETGASFLAGGALGRQTVRLLDASGVTTASAGFILEAETSIQDDGGRMADLLRLAQATLERPNESDVPTGGVGTLRWRGGTYDYFVPWIRDHVHTLKGMKYFKPCGAGFIDLFRETQREDGMIWDFFNGSARPTFYETAYGPLGYARRYDGLLMVRMPVEADVEYLFVEGIHAAWKATADDAWMLRQLDAAVRAMDYSTSDRARWSVKHGLIKRGYTIDTWDFQVDHATTRIFPRWSTLLVDPQRSRFGIMFGDNTGYVASCGYLAEMLERAGRQAEAARFRERAREMRARLDELAWAGTHFRHWVPEDETVVYDLGVDERSQVSLSNAYSLNRGIARGQAAAILRTYQRIRGALPPGSPGEWYAIHPPFQRGFEGHCAPWQYMNGGVSPIIAGELARGAFACGFESYGADILGRVLDLAKSSRNRIRFAYTGAFPPPPAARFTPVDLSRQANMDLGSQGSPGVPGWMAGSSDDHLGGLPTGRQEFAGVPFLVTDPAVNGRRAVVAVARHAGLPEKVSVPLGTTARSIYVLHSVGGVGRMKVAGAIVFSYEDGSEEAEYLVDGRNVAHWWYPALEPSWPAAWNAPRLPPFARLAWRGRNDICPDVGLHWLGIDNPHPERVIRAIDFRAALDGAIYAVAGLTLSDQALGQEPPAVSYGGPDNWAAGAVVYGLIEGLAGVEDRDVAFRMAGIAPRWPAAGTSGAKVVVHYPASHGYVAYNYAHDEHRREITLTVTGSGENAQCHVLLPAGVAAAAAVTSEAEPVATATSRVETSVYIDFELALPAPRCVRISY